MRKVWQTILLLCLVSWCGSALGSEAECSGDRCAIGIKEGKPAPFTGQLLSDPLAIDLGQKAEACDTRLEITTRYLERTAAVNIGEQKNLRANDKLFHETETRILKAAIRDARPKWYERPGVVLIVGFVAGAAAMAAIVKAERKILE